MSDWKLLETKVRQYSEYIWDRKAKIDRIGGVNFDCILEISEIDWIIIEITQNNSLEKIRGDISKIQSIRFKKLSENIMIRPFIVCDFEPTQGMCDAGKENHIEVLSFNNFMKKYFDFLSYQTIRMRKQFGSAIDPITGLLDETKYTPVKYINHSLGNQEQIDVTKIVDKLLNKEKIILLGDYGTGKSRCFSELFRILSQKANETHIYPIAIDLKDTWGLENAIEIIRRHFNHLGMNELHTNNVVKSFNGNNLCFLLDGFDEVGSRPWNEDRKNLVNLRKYALQGVKDLITKSDAGLIISGREHYFNSNEEMFSALGLKESNTSIIKCKDEFDIDEFEEFLNINNVNINLPNWIPKKPLVLKTIASMQTTELKELFSENENIGIWFKFIDYMCERDSKIHPVLDAITVKNVLKILSRKTRNKAQNIGPISTNEIIDAFQEATNSYPNEQATVMLQRLPGLGRVNAETGDRNFIDNFILDGLRAIDISASVISNSFNLLNERWVHPLKSLGTEILAFDINNNKNHSIYIDLAKKGIRSEKNNKVILSDIISALSKTNIDHVDYNGLIFNEPYFGVMDLSRNTIHNLILKNGVLEELRLGKQDPIGLSICNCEIAKLVDIASDVGMPNWIKDSTVSEFSAVDTLTAIKNSGLNNAQTILISILIKVYRQAGNGRLEHTLTKGLSQVNKRVMNDVLHYLIKNKFLTTSKDKSEIIYKPVRTHQGRIDAILSELDRSKDEIWLNVSAME